MENLEAKLTAIFSAYLAGAKAHNVEVRAEDLASVAMREIPVVKCDRCGCYFDTRASDTKACPHCPKPNKVTSDLCGACGNPRLRPAMDEMELRKMLAEEVEKRGGPPDYLAMLANPWMEIDSELPPQLSAPLAAMMRLLPPNADPSGARYGR